MFILNILKLLTDSLASTSPHLANVGKIVDCLGYLSNLLDARLQEAIINVLYTLIGTISNTGFIACQSTVPGTEA
jgi:hypothetical protein